MRKFVDVGDMTHDIRRRDDIRRASVSKNFSSERRVEELTGDCYALGFSDIGYGTRGFDAEVGDTAFGEVGEENAVIRPKFHDERRSVVDESLCKYIVCEAREVLLHALRCA